MEELLETWKMAIDADCIMYHSSAVYKCVSVCACVCPRKNENATQFEYALVAAPFSQVRGLCAAHSGSLPSVEGIFEKIGENAKSKVLAGPEKPCT